MKFVGNIKSKKSKEVKTGKNKGNEYWLLDIEGNIVSDFEGESKGFNEGDYVMADVKEVQRGEKTFYNLKSIGYVPRMSVEPGRSAGESSSIEGELFDSIVIAGKALAKALEKLDKEGVKITSEQLEVLQKLATSVFIQKNRR